MSSLTHFPFEPVSEDYSFLEQAVADFEQCMDSILTNSVKTHELNASFGELDGVTSSVSSGFLHSGPFLTLLSHSLFLSSNLVSYGARLEYYILSVQMAGKSYSDIWYPVFTTRYHPANAKTYQFLSDWH